jgi:hypothetical protein
MSIDLFYDTYFRHLKPKCHNIRKCQSLISTKVQTFIYKTLSRKLNKDCATWTPQSTVSTQVLRKGTMYVKHEPHNQSCQLRCSGKEQCSTWVDMVDCGIHVLHTLFLSGAPELTRLIVGFMFYIHCSFPKHLSWHGWLWGSCFTYIVPPTVNRVNSGAPERNNVCKTWIPQSTVSTQVLRKGTIRQNTDIKDT